MDDINVLITSIKDDYYRRERKLAFIATLSQRCKKLPLIKRNYYTLKTMICLLLKLESKKFLNGYDVAKWDEACFEGDRHWTQLIVGKGLLTGWYYNIYTKCN